MYDKQKMEKRAFLCGVHVVLENVDVIRIMTKRFDLERLKIVQGVYIVLLLFIVCLFIVARFQMQKREQIFNVEKE